MINRNYYSFLLLSASSMLIAACAVDKKNGENNRDIEVVVSPNLGVTAKEPNSILYKSSKTNVNSLRSLWVTSQPELTGVYRANGNGGLGVEFNENDSLEPYEGIPIEIKNNDKKLTPKITVESDGEIICKNLFTYENNYIRINNVNLNGLTICDVKITATGIKNDVAISDSATIKVKLNLTMQDYASKNDTTYKYLETYSSLNSPKLVARWLKDTANGNRLNLSYDYAKSQIVGKKMVDTYALTGAQILKSLDVSGSDVSDFRAIALLDNLEELDISNTKVDVKDLALVQNIKKLKTLSIREMGIKNFSTIVNYLSNIESLDISYNKNIDELNGISKLKNLRILKSAGVGLKNLNEFKDANQIISLDISDNDLSKITKEDAQILVNMYNLTELNISNTHIKDDVLDVLFAKFGARSNLRKLVLRNNSSNGDVSCSSINIIDNIKNIKKLTALEYLDLHGNGCKRNDYGYFLEGLKDTYSFIGMHNLKYLDISATAVSDLSGLKNTTNEFQLKFYDKDDGGGISMTKEACNKTLNYHPDCANLRRGREIFAEYNKAGESKFKVPQGVYKLKILTCSGGDGGQGGQGGQGGVSSAYLPDNNIQGQTCPTGWTQTWYAGSAYCWAPGASGNLGALGEQGKLTKISSNNFSFESTQETFFQNTNGFCGAGVGGAGGNSGGINCSWWGHCGDAPQPQGGANGNAGQNKRLITQEFEVSPEQTINILVGAGGAGGTGGSGGIFGWCGNSQEGRDVNGIACGWRGNNGHSGGNGTDGYVKIEWLE